MIAVNDIGKKYFFPFFIYRIFSYIYNISIYYYDRDKEK